MFDESGKFEYNGRAQVLGNQFVLSGLIAKLVQQVLVRLRAREPEKTNDKNTLIISVRASSVISDLLVLFIAKLFASGNLN